MSEPQPSAANSQANRRPGLAVDAVARGRLPRIGAQSCVRAGAVLGAEVEIGEHVLIDDGVVVGSRVRILDGAKLYAGSEVADDVAIDANAVIASGLPVLFDRCGPPCATRIGQGVRVGANAVVLAGMMIGDRAQVGAGAVVNADVPRDAIVAGNPARIVGYVDTPITRPNPLAESSSSTKQALRVRGASLVVIPQVNDLRGQTTFAEFGKELPFVAERFFFVTDVPGREVRGEHAHKTLHEFLVCLKGAMSVMLDDGTAREEIRLESPTLGLHVPPQVWRVVYKYTPDALLLSLCSHPYDPGDYIRDYTEFRDFVGVRR